MSQFTLISVSSSNSLGATLLSTLILTLTEYGAGKIWENRNIFNFNKVNGEFSYDIREIFQVKEVVLDVCYYLNSSPVFR